MDLDELLEKKSELDSAKEKLSALFGDMDSPITSDTEGWEIGKNYLIRTVTHIQTGRLVSVGIHEIVITEAAWIADTGRFADSLINCDFNEVEPFPVDSKVLIGRGSLIDAVQIKEIPQVQK